MIALDALEQMDAEPFELIGADAGRHGLAGRIEIGCRSRPRSICRIVMRAIDDILEQYLAIARDGDGGIQLMAVAGESAQLLRGLRAAGGLVEKPLAERQRLIGADHDICRDAGRDRTAPSRAPAARRSRRAPKGLKPAESRARRCRPERFEVDAGIGQQRLPRAALRGQDQRIFSAPELMRKSFRKPLPLPVGEQFHDRRGGFLDRAPRDVEQRPVELGAQPPRITRPPR